MKTAYPVTPLDANTSQIHFPEIIVGVQNSRLSDTFQAYRALSVTFTGNRLAQAMAALADAWFDPHYASMMDS